MDNTRHMGEVTSRRRSLDSIPRRGRLMRCTRRLRCLHDRVRARPDTCSSSIVLGTHRVRWEQQAMDRRDMCMRRQEGRRMHRTGTRRSTVDQELQ